MVMTGDRRNLLMRMMPLSTNPVVELRPPRGASILAFYLADHPALKSDPLSEPGIEWQSVKDADKPSKSRVLRLTQLRGIMQRARAEIETGELPSLSG